MPEHSAEYEYILVMPEQGQVGIGPTTDLRAVEQDREDWEAETGRVGTIMRRPVADWEEMPTPPAMPTRKGVHTARHTMPGGADCPARPEPCAAPPGNLCTDTGCWDADRCTVYPPAKCTLPPGVRE